MDRNNGVPYSAAIRLASLSARRAWIEIHVVLVAPAGFWVALRKESVDRNTKTVALEDPESVALRKESVDRNRNLLYRRFRAVQVALRKESVDRNTWLFIPPTPTSRRSPQGERG